LNEIIICSSGVFTTPQLPGGFTTASGKASRVDPATLARARRIFAEVDEHSVTLEDSNETGLGGFVTGASVQTELTCSSGVFTTPQLPTGFGTRLTTASGKISRVDPAALSCARRVFAKVDEHAVVGSEDSRKNGPSESADVDLLSASAERIFTNVDDIASHLNTTLTCVRVCITRKYPTLVCM
jgi:hypothetical protein